MGAPQFVQKLAPGVRGWPHHSQKAGVLGPELFSKTTAPPATWSIPGWTKSRDSLEAWEEVCCKVPGSTKSVDTTSA